VIRYTHISLHGLANLLNDHSPPIWEVMEAAWVVPAERLDDERRRNPGLWVVEGEVWDAGDSLIERSSYYDTTYRLGCTWEKVIAARQSRTVFRSVDGNIVRGPAPVVQERFWGPEQYQSWMRGLDTELGPHAVECLECKKLAAYCLWERLQPYRGAVQVSSEVSSFYRCFNHYTHPLHGLFFFRPMEWVVWAKWDRILPWTTEGLAQATDDQRVAFDAFLVATGI
jgi:hypothetical protein